MKKLIIMFLVFISGFAVSCKKENVVSQNPPSEPAGSEMDGTWNLVLITGGLIGLNETYQTGLILWTFNPGDSTLVVQNNSGTAVYYSLPSGTYPYFETEVNGVMAVNVNGEILGNQVIYNDTLDIAAEQIVSDGFSFRFVR